MVRKILVPLERNDRIDLMIPLLEAIAQPGKTLIFLTRYPVKLRAWFKDHWVTTESRAEAVRAGSKVIENYSMEAQRRLAEEVIRPVREKLSKKGVEVTVHVYTGSLRRALGDYHDGEATYMRPTRPRKHIFNVLGDALRASAREVQISSTAVRVARGCLRVARQAGLGRLFAKLTTGCH